MNASNNNSDKGMSATNWIALGGLFVASLTCYFSFCSKPEPPNPTVIEVKPTQTVNVNVPTNQSGNPKPTKPEEITGHQVIQNPTANSSAIQPEEQKIINRVETRSQLASETAEYSFRINECKWVGDNVQISMTVISKGKDRDLGIATRVQQGSTKIYDNLNAEYLVNKIKIANNSSREGGGSINQMLIKDVPTDVTLMFSEVNSDAKSIALLHIGCYNNFDPIQFRNIPIGFKASIKPDIIEVENNSKKHLYDNGDYSFEVNECKRQGENVIIKLTAISKGKDRNLGIATVGQQQACTIYDNNNNEYVVQQVKIANETTRLGGGSINQILIKNIPTNISLLFSDVSEEAQSISLLKIGCYYDFDPIQFRKISIQ